MDDILTDVNENWSEDDAQRPTGMQQYDFLPISQNYPLNFSIDSKEATIICERRSVYFYSPFDTHQTSLNQFEEYISAALSSVKYRDFIGKGENGGVIITGGTGTKKPQILHDVFSDFKSRRSPNIDRGFQPFMDIRIQSHKCV
jgi:hypothetical protein